MAAVFATGVASGLQGMRFARMEPDGAVPLEDGDRTAASATGPEAALLSAASSHPGHGDR